MRKATYYITRTGELHQLGLRSGDRYLGTVRSIQRDPYVITIFYHTRLGKPRYAVMDRNRFRDERMQRAEPDA